MRQSIIFICALLALSLPAIAAGRPGAPGDGTLTVKDANAYQITMNVKGGLIGRCDQCTLRVVDPNPDDQYEEVVTGADRPPRYVNDKITVYQGRYMKYRYIGGNFRIRLGGAGITFAFIGKGLVTLVGSGTVDDGTYGTYSVNGAEPQLLPARPAAAVVTLGTSPTP